MSKKRAIRRFVFLAIVVAIGIFLSVASFDVPFTYYHYNGFAGAIPLGLDLSGGLSVVYECHTSGNKSDLASGVDATVTRLQELLYSEGYSEALVSRQGSNKIRVEVPGVNDTGEIFDFLENPQTLYMTDTQATSTVTPTAAITGADITNVNVSYNSQQSQYGVTLRFSSEGRTKFSEFTKSVANGDKNIYIYFGEISPSNTPWTLTCEEQITGGSTFISGGSITDYDSAKEFALNLMSGTFDVELELLEKSNISATLGQNALLYGIIAGAVALVLIMALLWWRYRDFGLLANFALLIYLVLMMFFLQAIPFVQLTLPGIAGIILSLGMAVDGNIIIFERIKEEYAAGKKMHLAVKGGFKKAFWPIFDSNITTIFTSIILWILGSAAIKGFAITLLLGILLSMFTTLVVTRFLCKTYLGINSTKPQKARLVREAGVVEIIEEDEKPGKEIIVEGGDENA